MDISESSSYNLEEIYSLGMQVATIPNLSYIDELRNDLVKKLRAFGYFQF